ncbi:MAG: carbonic anhydrase [Gammaproteobacteria bacterium]|nr:carbonic anhydrase [Gammaproteobacteria bacterium]
MFKSSPLKKLIRGYFKFKTQYYQPSFLNELMQTLAKEGQKPKIMIIGCCDSRVDPNTLFNCSPGQLFTVRNVANLVPPCDPSPHHHSTSSALEFAVQALHVEHIIILGHSQCGGIKALLNMPDSTLTNPSDNGFIYNWMKIAKEAKSKALIERKGKSRATQARFCEEEALKISLSNLKTFPWIAKKVTSGALSLHAWRFDLVTGNLQHFVEKTNRFEDVTKHISNI